MARFTRHAIDVHRANDLIGQWHRHCGPVLISLDFVELREAGRPCGVGALGTPSSRILDDGVTLEVRRTATDGTEHACSAVLGALARCAARRGVLRLVTYTREGESGASLRGAGWQLDEAYHRVFDFEGPTLTKRLVAKPPRSWASADRPGRREADGAGRFRWWKLLPAACTFEGALALGQAAARAGQVSGNPFPIDGLHSKWWSVWRDGFDYPEAA